MENTKFGWTDFLMQLTELRESEDRGDKLQEILEFFAKCYIMKVSMSDT